MYQAVCFVGPLGRQASMKSIIKKLLICLSQLMWVFPASVLGYLFAHHAEENGFLREGHDLGKLGVLLGVWLLFCGVFIPIWIWFVKITGISSSKEFKELEEAMRGK